MSSRALRKAQREKEDQERLKQLEDEAAALEDEESDHDVSIAFTRKSAFSMLQDDDNNDEEEQDNDMEDLAMVGVKVQPAQQTSKKKKKKKKKAKTAHVSDSQEHEHDDGRIDEIDAALKELSTNDTSQSSTTTAGVDRSVDEANRLLGIDTSHLHAQNEMRRLFGRTALQREEEEQPQPDAVGGNRRQQRRVQQVGLAQALRGQRQNGRSGGLTAVALRRNIFIQGKEEWPVATGGGLGMEVEQKRADGTIVYRFVHNIAYQDVQSQFESCVASMDPNRLVALCQMNPYHISTLLQVSEIAKQERNHATAGDLLERALFSFGRAVHSTFSKNLAEGKARLDFRRAENREFWLASWRYMQNLTMRATWRTVYGWAKLLLSLSPEHDPYSIWLVLDQYALRARQDLDFLNISRNTALKEVHGSTPNVQLSQSLAECRAGNEGKGKQALFTAIGKFPWVVARLMQELNLDPPPAVWGQESRSVKEKLHAELYAIYAKDIWNTPENTALLVEIASALPPGNSAAPINAEEVSRNEARHVLLSDNTTLIALVPRKFTQQMDNASDPLPPDDAFMPHLSRSEHHSRRSTRDVSAEEEEDMVSELQNMFEYFSQLFPWFTAPRSMVTGENVGTDGTTEPHELPESPEMMIRDVDAAGITREEFHHHLDRFIELSERLSERPQAIDRAVTTGVLPRLSGSLQAQHLARLGQNFGLQHDWDPDSGEDDHRPNQPRVEDAPEEL